jgi:ribosomal protein S6
VLADGWIAEGDEFVQWCGLTAVPNERKTTVKRYEGLFVLDLAGKEDGLKEVVDKVTGEIAAAGGRVETVQKMEKKAFVRPARNGHTGGHFVNVIFEAKAGVVGDLQARFKLAGEVVRVLFTEAPPMATPAKT